jgi:hypothetical protein
MKRVTKRNLLSVMGKLTEYAKETKDNPDACKAFCADLNAFLDELANQDAFGTEGQCDPRGDQRDAR